MSFSTGLSGVAAASKDLSITGNNIANASTTGFKASRAEFGDAYTNSILGTGQDTSGSGVTLENVGQKFEQGDINDTDSVLDLAIDGTGFFITKYNNGDVTYTRSGIFGTDDEGYIVTTSGAKLQGYATDGTGKIISGVLDDLQVDTSNQAPRGTTSVLSEVNVPAGAQVLQSDGQITTTNGLAVGVAQVGPAEDSATTLSTLGYPTTAGTRSEFQGAGDITTTGILSGGPWTPSAVEANWSFGITVQGPNIAGGTATLTDTIQPFSDTTTYSTVSDLVGAINSALRGSDLAGKVSAEVNAAGTGIDFVMSGTYATDGSAIVSIADATGNLLTDPYLGFDTYTVVSPVTGTDLFASGGSIDLSSDPGAAASVQGNIVSELNFYGDDPGTYTTVASGTTMNALDSVGNFADADAGDDIVFTAVVGSASSSVTLTVPAGGWASQAAFATDLETAINTQLGGTYVSVNVNASTNQLEVTADTAAGTGPVGISFIHDGTNNTSAGVNMSTLGMATASSPGPTTTLGDAAVLANNQLQISVDGGAYSTITIPEDVYSNYDSLVAAINTQILITPALSGEVEVSHTNGRIMISRTEVGAFPLDVNITGTDEALESLGLNSTYEIAGEDPIDRTNSFRINLIVPDPDPEERSGSVEISLNEEITSIDQLAAAINRELASVDADDYIGVQAVVSKDADGNDVLQFVATEEGEASQITISNIQAIGDDIDISELYALLQVDPYDAGLLEVGEAAVDNGYPEQSFYLVDPDGDSTRITIDEGAQASVIAAQLTNNSGITASAETTVQLLADDYVNSGNMDIYINDQVITADNFQDMVDEINKYQQTSLNSITAEYDADTGNITLTSSTGIDISVRIESSDSSDQLVVRGLESTASQTLGGADGAETNAVIGGTVEIILNEGYSMTDPDPRVTGLFNGLSDSSFEDYTINAFDPADPDTYNETATIAIYDSLGNQHDLQLYYVKNPSDENTPLSLNSWTVYAQIDGADIGDPDTSLDFPANTEPTMASHLLYFNADGTLNVEATGDWLVSNWDPVDEEGNPTGAYSSVNVSEGGSLPISEPSTSSNFAISFDETTQWGTKFTNDDFQQNGYASGSLTDLQIEDDGTIYAHYTNGESRALGQVVLATFNNIEGLIPVGSSEWVESYESGNAIVGVAGTGTLGSIDSSALEDSTVELSEELVHLIIAQRNYQASAKTIETANAVTQTIINLR
ncbi:flagellar hook-basal body complex protein [Gynuella sunshinyii]|uniref:Flagellar hook protein FlgE n=1 Tax=Gynuella sunshinyii YC6258 TaxID=1445510 RepID=A0A0C5VBT4_9GAMM|nr:flagellar hook-basal body complex protein [Gynuella sunshinyii]AJQ96780.1 flagellar hook protein FlgE [Gynuella sunshinyii YC6258]